MAITLTNQEIQKLIPHRYPMLLVDRVIECDDQKRIVGIKNISVNEPFFQGHFPGTPIMPGVLQLEAMARSAESCIAARPALMVFYLYLWGLIMPGFAK